MTVNLVLAFMARHRNEGPVLSGRAFGEFFAEEPIHDTPS